MTIESGVIDFGCYHYLIHADGGKNKAQGVYGSYKIRAADGRERIERLTFDAEGTHNDAEYQALIAALEDLETLISGAGRDTRLFNIKVRMDSQTILGQVFWGWKCNYDHLAVWMDRAKTVAAKFGMVDGEHISGNVMKGVLGH